MKHIFGAEIHVAEIQQASKMSPKILQNSFDRGTLSQDQLRLFKLLYCSYGTLTLKMIIVKNIDNNNHLSRVFGTFST